MVVYGDELAERFGLTRGFIGLFFLAIATELPEIVTTISAANFRNAPLVLGSMFGGVTAKVDLPRNLVSQLRQLNGHFEPKANLRCVAHQCRLRGRRCYSLRFDGTSAMWDKVRVAVGDCCCRYL